MIVFACSPHEIAGSFLSWQISVWHLLEIWLLNLGRSVLVSIILRYILRNESLVLLFPFWRAFGYHLESIIELWRLEHLLDRLVRTSHWLWLHVARVMTTFFILRWIFIISDHLGGHAAHPRISSYAREWPKIHRWLVLLASLWHLRFIVFPIVYSFWNKILAGNMIKQRLVLYRINHLKLAQLPYRLLRCLVEMRYSYFTGHFAGESNLPNSVCKIRSIFLIVSDGVIVYDATFFEITTLSSLDIWVKNLFFLYWGLRLVLRPMVVHSAVHWGFQVCWLHRPLCPCMVP